MQKVLIILGIGLFFLGIIYLWLLKIGFGRLPGDIYFKIGEFAFYLPITSCIIVSLILSIIIKWMR